MPFDPGTGADMSPERFWDLYGASLYALARALLGDDAAALHVVPRAMVDLFSSTGGEAPMSTEPTLRAAAACVYDRCYAALSKDPRNGTRATPPPVSLGELEGAQRAALALCIFGGHTYRQAAARLDMASEVAADLLTSGLRDLSAVTPRAGTTG